MYNVPFTIYYLLFTIFIKQSKFQYTILLFIIRFKILLHTIATTFALGLVANKLVERGHGDYHSSIIIGIFKVVFEKYVVGKVELLLVLYIGAIAYHNHFLESFYKAFHADDGRDAVGIYLY